MAAARGGKIMNRKVSDGTDSTIYSDPVVIPSGNTFSLQLDVTETTATYAAVVTLWATNDEDAFGATDDTGWEQMTADHGWTGFPGLTSGAIADGDQESQTVGNAGHLGYRLKIVRSGGAATINAFGIHKDNS
jgi:hypothetical protein